MISYFPIKISTLFMIIIVTIFIVYAEELYKQLYPGRLVGYLSRDEFHGKIIQTIFVFLSISVLLGFVVL